MEIFLQVWGGLFYLLNKIFFSFAERDYKNAKKSWQKLSWIVYIIGLPGIVGILVLKHNWIFAALEVGGAPSMFLGLFIAIRGKGYEPKWLNHFAALTIFIGLGYSFYDFGGITSLTQWLEIGSVVGFLIGTYRLANEKADGYLWYLLMSATALLLFWIQDLTLLVAQQIVSTLFIVDAYLAWRRNRSKLSEKGENYE